MFICEKNSRWKGISNYKQEEIRRVKMIENSKEKNGTKASGDGARERMNIYNHWSRTRRNERNFE